MKFVRHNIVAVLVITAVFVLNSIQLINKHGLSPLSRVNRFSFSSYSMLPSQLKSVLTSRQCTEAHHVYFLKVHKAGSTTIQNIFWRFGFMRNLSILVFPNTIMSYPRKNFLSMLPFRGRKLPRAQVRYILRTQCVR